MARRFSATCIISRSPRSAYPLIPLYLICCNLQLFLLCYPMFELRLVSIFNTLSAGEAREISPYFLSGKYGKKETIFSEGDPSEWLYIVKKGKVKITKISHDGKEII